MQKSALVRYKFQIGNARYELIGDLATGGVALVGYLKSEKRGLIQQKIIFSHPQGDTMTEKIGDVMGVMLPLLCGRGRDV